MKMIMSRFHRSFQLLITAVLIDQIRNHRVPVPVILLVGESFHRWSLRYSQRLAAEEAYEAVPSTVQNAHSQFKTSHRH